MEANNVRTAAISGVIVGVAALPPVIGPVVLAPAAAAIAGAVAGWRVAGGRQGLAAGIAVGAGALIGTVIALTAFFLILAANPDFVEYARMSEPHPEARLPYELVTPLAAGAGVVAGFFAGLENLVFAVVSGGVAGLVSEWRIGSRSAGALR